MNRRAQCMTLLRLLLPAMVVLGAARCGQLTRLAGAGVETTNGSVAGLLVLENGQPASKALVRLYPADYGPFATAADVPLDTADVAGRFEIDRIKKGTYTIVAAHAGSGEMAATYGITIDDDTMNLAPVTIRPPGSIKIQIPDGFDTANGNFYIPGTGFSIWLKNASAGWGNIDSIPVGEIPGIVYAAKSGGVAAAPRLLRDSVTILPGQITVVAHLEWKHERRLVLNTGSTGAGVGGTVTNFPALVRLTAEHFDFSQVKDNGGDIRFAKSDTTFLPCEIDRWDAIQKHANVWVKVDTVHGNDSTQSIALYWGNPDAVDISSGAAVFDSASGFEGVWHLNETSGTRATDASCNGFAGTYKGALPNSESAPVGICQFIGRPDSDYIDVGDVLNPGVKNISVGVWVKRAAFGSPQALIAKTNGDAPSAEYGYLFSFDPYNFPHFHIVSGGTNWGDDGTFNFSSTQAITDSTTWHFVYVVINRSDNSYCKMYVDGIDRTGSSQGNITSVTAVANTLRLCIGTESDNNNSYKGAISEATISFTARSADWAKLSYMNQKEQDALVKW